MKASTAVFHCLAVCNVLASTSKILTSAVQVISTNEEDVYRHENDHSDYAKYVRSYLPQARDNASYYPPGLAEREWRLMFSKLDTSVNEATSSSQDLMGSFNIVQKMDQYLDPQCRESMAYMRHAASHHKLWALRMADANGKLQSGIMYGKFSSPGDWEECVRIRAPPEIWNNRVQSFRGKYCLIDFRLPMPERPYDRALSVHEPVLNLTGTESARLYPSIINYTAYASVFYELGYLHALCLPSNCDANNVAQAIGKVVEGIHLIVSNQIDCQYDSDTIWDRLRVSTIISILLLVALFTVTFTSSWLYYKHRQYPDSKSMARHMPVIKCFAMQPNFERLTKPDPRSLTFVHYTRIVAMGLTVVTHTGGLGTLQAITKPADGTNAESIFRDFLPQMMANAFTSIQVFFFMAGLMLVLSTWPAMRRSGGKLSFIEYAIKRAVRLLPGIIITIALNFIWPLFADGPMLSYFERIIVQPCERNWWRTLMFLSNFDHVDEMCLRHSYFSASDYQLHLLAFPILIITYHKPNVGLGIASVLTVSGFMAQFIMVATKTVLPFMMVDYLDKAVLLNVIHYIHHPVWNHVSSFFAGYIVGYLVVKQVRWNISAVTVKRLWIVSLPLGLGAIFAPYYWNHYKRPIERWHTLLYVILDRLALILMCSWLSYGSMVMGRPPPRRRTLPTVEVPQTIEKAEKPKQDSGFIDQSDQSVLLNNGSNNCSLTGIHMSASHNNLTRIDFSSNPATLTSSRSIGGYLNNLASDPKSFEEAVYDEGPKRSSPMQLNTHLDVSNTSNNSLNKQASVPGSSIVDSSNKTFAADGLKPQQSQRRVSQAKQTPVNREINTLSLVLSRLTFQLYLFNMVVLWFDVNHSKYQWYFSYYFIFTKAFAVYIMSAVLATIFFVTFESPCLSLYILWVKRRAERKAEREEDRKCEQEVAYRRKVSMANFNQHHKEHHGLEMKSHQNIPMQYIDGTDSNNIVPIHNTSRQI